MAKKTAAVKPAQKKRVVLTERDKKTMAALVGLADGGDLYWWHPLVSGDPETVHQAGISVRGRVAASEDDVRDEDLEDRIVGWPARMPKAARKPRRER